MINSENYFKNLLSNPSDYDKLKFCSNISELFEYTTTHYNSLIALRDKDKCYTYNQLAKDVAITRGKLLQNNIKKGDRVGLIFLNEYAFVKSILAVMTIGAIAVLLPTKVDNGLVDIFTNYFELKCVLYSDSLKDHFVDYNQNSFINVSQLSPFDNAETESDITISPDDIACIVFSGGTTGKAKGAILTHRNLCRGAYNGCLFNGKIFNRSYISVIPFTHIFGLVRNLLSILLSGSELYLLSQPKNLVKEGKIANPEIMVLTPAIAKLVYTLIQAYGKSIFGDKLEIIIAGGAPVPEDLVKAFGNFKIKCCQGYGSTESTNLISGNGSPLEKPASVGVVYPNQEVMIKEGEIIVKGDNVFKGYYRKDSETKTALKDGYLHTGDLGYFDDDGFLYIIGRKNNLIVLPNGLKISPESIEAEINRNKLVSDSIVSYDNEHNTLNVEIYVNESQRFLDYKEKIINYIKNTINKNPTMVKEIDNISFRDKDFPRSPAQKILRNL